MATPMNVILLIIDSLRADHVGCYGNTWIKTPAIDSLAPQSVKFTRAYNESLPTIPVRRAIHTGMRTFPFRNYQAYKGDWVKARGWQPIPEEQVTLSEILQHAGYRTALITDTYHVFKPSMNFHRGFDQFNFIRGQEMDYHSSLSLAEQWPIDHFLTPMMKDRRVHQLLLRYLANVANRKGEEDHFAPQVFRAGIQWLQENRGVKPFFLVLDSFDPHEPWDPPQKYRDLYDPGYK
ncbi:MAG: sulfatase, partial [Dehalococcoidia bacterium]